MPTNTLTPPGTAPTPSPAAGDPAATLEQRVAEIEARYAPQLRELEQEGEALGKQVGDPGTAEVIINVDVDVEWRNTSVVVNIPEVTIRNRAIALDLPEVTARRKRVIFSVPEIRMERRCLTKKPEIHGTTIKWKCVYVSMPVTRMVPKEIVTDIPQVTFERRDLVLGIPQITMKPKRFTVKLPHFTLKNVRAETKRIEEEGKELQARGEQIGRSMQAEIEAAIASLGNGVMGALAPARRDVERQFEEAAATVDGAIKDLQAAGIDPIKAPVEGGDVNLRKLLADLLAREQEALAAVTSGLEFNAEG